MAASWFDASSVTVDGSLPGHGKSRSESMAASGLVNRRPIIA